MQAEPAPSWRADAREQQLPAANEGGRMQAEGGLLGQAYYLVPACQLPGVLQLQQASLGLPLMVPGSGPLPASHREEPSGQDRGAPGGCEAPALDMQQGSGSCVGVEPAGRGSPAAQGPQSPDSAAGAAGHELQDAGTSTSQRHPSAGDEACEQDVGAQAEASWHCFSAVTSAWDLAWRPSCIACQSCSTRCWLSSGATASSCMMPRCACHLQLCLGW